MISYITGYLDWQEIELLKTCCYLISIVCLEEMNKYSIGICDSNDQLLDSYKFKGGDRGVFLNDALLQLT